VPNFVLKELQHIADSPDSLRRNRGRRGLDILSMMQNESPVPVRITDMDAPQARDADSKLVLLARRLTCPIMTNDYNLNKVAELQGINVLNIMIGQRGKASPARRGVERDHHSGGQGVRPGVGYLVDAPWSSSGNTA
jgi:uncharacterized protein YacL